MDYVDPKIRPQVDAIKRQLRTLGWTVARPDTHGHMNHGPIATRTQAEALYMQWHKLVDPWSWSPQSRQTQ